MSHIPFLDQVYPGQIQNSKKQIDPLFLMLLETSGITTSFDVDQEYMITQRLLDLKEFLGFSIDKQNLLDWVDDNQQNTLNQLVKKAYQKNLPQIEKIIFIDHIQGIKKECHLLAYPFTPFIRFFLFPSQEKVKLPEKAHKLSHLGKLSATIVHDLNNLFTGAISCSSLLQKEVKDPYLKKYVEIINSTLGQASHLTRGILSYVREESNQEFSSCYPIECIKELKPLFKTLVPKQIDLSFDLGDQDVMIKLPREKLMQLILNLVVNAKEAIENSGSIHIQTKYQDKYFVLKISDNGCGIEKDLQNKIFNPFYTSDKKSGTGLGLTIVKRIIDQAEGIIELESKKGEGSTFTLNLPIK